MKNRTKILISILAGFIVLLGCGVWLFQSLRSEPAPTGEEAAPLTNLTAMLNAHDTIVTAQYQESSDPYTTDGGESWYVDSTYTVQESLRGELQPGDTLTFSEPVSSKTGTPYSQKVAINATDSTLLLLRKDGNTYRISAPSLCLQPVQAVSFWGTETIRKINWLCGATRTTVTPMNGGERFTVYTTGHDATPQDQFLNEIAWSDTSRESVNFLYALVHVIHEYEGDTIASMLERSDGVMAADITAISDPYERESRWYRDLTVTVGSVYQGLEGIQPGDSVTVTCEFGSPHELPFWYQPDDGEVTAVFLLRQEDGALSLCATAYDSLCGVLKERGDRILWFSGQTGSETHGGLRDIKALDAYYREKE